MAASAFKSTSRRSSIAPGDAKSSNRAAGAHRRSRSLSRHSGRFPPPPPEPDDFTTPRGKFVNKTRGLEFPEISLDDLADEYFGTKGFEVEEDEIRSDSFRTGRSSRRSDGERFRMETESSRRRGRSVSKKGSIGLCDGSRQQRRSVSVAGRRSDGLESDTDKSYDSSKLSFDNGNFQQSSSKNKTTSHVFRKSTSQKAFVSSLDNYSSHSSSVTDDEVLDIHSNKTGPVKTIKTIYTLEKPEHPTGDGDGSGFYEAMRNEVRHAVYEIRTELEKVMGKTEPITLANGDVNQPKGSKSLNIIAEIRRNYTNKLEESEKRKQELLAKLAAEEQHGQELSDIVRELLPVPKQAISAERPSRSRRRSNDRTRMSKCLSEEAERYFEDFLSNVEDTDISSIDGERSDTSSTLGGSLKQREPSVHSVISEAHAVLSKATSLHSETDGVLLPWLEWETSNDVIPSPCKSKAGVPWTAAQEANAACDNTTQPSSLGSWSPEGNNCSPSDSRGVVGKRSSGVGSNHLMRSSSPAAAGAATSPFDMDEYAELRRSEQLLFEMFKQRQSIESGSLVLCGGRAP